MWLAEMRRLWSHIAEGGRGCDKTLMLNSCREEAWVTSKMLRACSISTYTMQYTHTLYFIVIIVAVHGIKIPTKTWSSKRSANKQMKRRWEGKFRQRSLQRQWPFFFSWHTNKRTLWNSAAGTQRCKILLRSLLLFAGRWMARDGVVVIVVVVGEWVATHVVHQRRQQRGVYQLLIGREWPHLRQREGNCQLGESSACRTKPSFCFFFCFLCLSPYWWWFSSKLTALTHGNVIFDILKPSAFQKYSICWVFRSYSVQPHFQCKLKSSRDQR